MSNGYWAESKDDAAGQMASGFDGPRERKPWLQDALNWYSEHVGKPIADLLPRGGGTSMDADTDSLAENTAEFVESYRTGQPREAVEGMFSAQDFRRMDEPSMFAALKDMMGLRSPMDGADAVVERANQKWMEVTGTEGPFMSYEDLTASLSEPGVVEVLGQ